MARKPRFLHPLRHLRTVLGLTQLRFAKLIGCSASAVQRIENGSLKMSHELAQRVMDVTGSDPVQLLAGQGKAIAMMGNHEYTKEDYALARSVVPSDEIQYYYKSLAQWIRILLFASTRGGQSKTNAVFSVMEDFLQQLAYDFDLKKNIDGLLTQLGWVRRRTYQVGNLRQFPEYARILGFKDNQDYKPDQTVAFTYPYGWIWEFVLLESPQFPEEVQQRLGDTVYLLDWDRPIPPEVAEAAKDATWVIKEFKRRFSAPDTTLNRPSIPASEIKKLLPRIRRYPSPNAGGQS